jgi:ribosomal protein S18 acetylase RimI-like enzyme
MLRKLETRDIEACAKIAKALSDWFTKEEVSKIKSDAAVNPAYVYEEGGEILAFIIVQDKLTSELEILHLAVTPEAQNKGIGTRLLKHIEYLGANRITVKTLDESVDYEPYVKTRNFYLKNGFVKKEVIENPDWDPGNPCLILSKDLVKL